MQTTFGATVRAFGLCVYKIVKTRAFLNCKFYMFVSLGLLQSSTSSSCKKIEKWKQSKEPEEIVKSLT